MWDITIQNKKIEKKFSAFYDLHFDKLDCDQQKLIRIVILRYKKLGYNDYYILFALIYGLVFFKVLKSSDPMISDMDRDKIDIMFQSFYYEVHNKQEELLNLIFLMDDNFLILKMSFKYSVILLGPENNKLITNKENYNRSMGWLIPYLTLKESPYLGFFQDYYFKTNYPKEYNETKNAFLQQISQIELPWEYMIGIINDITDSMKRAHSLGYITVRKKSYFSLFNKMQRKDYNHFSDSIWIRIIFENKVNLKKFVKQYEDDFIYSEKKDYIAKPKANGYSSIHYRYLSLYRSNEILVELQIRTKKMDDAIHDIRSISHFNYTVNENKWSPLFKEVQQWYDYTMSIVDKKRGIK